MRCVPSVASILLLLLLPLLLLPLHPFLQQQA